MNRIPGHIGIIPDGNRRWAQAQGLAKKDGYSAGLEPGLQLFYLCKDLGVKELTFYGFTQDNTKRSKDQTKAFTSACIKAVEIISKEDAELLIVGNIDSPLFPDELLPYALHRTTFGSGGLRLNFLVNYGWQWDLSLIAETPEDSAFSKRIQSSDISRVDLIIRWGGRRRLSGFLPVQSVYADFYIVDSYWPDFKPEHFYQALEWYQTQDVTLGG